MNSELESGAVSHEDSAENLANLANAELEAELDDSLAEESELDGEETESQEPEDGSEEQKKKGSHQTTLEERAEQLAEKKVQAALAKFKEEQAEIEKRVNEKLEADKKPYVELSQTDVDRLNANYAAAYERKLELEELFRFESDPGEKSKLLVDLRRTEKWLVDTENWYSANETKKAEYLKTKEQIESDTAHAKEQAQRLETTAEVFRTAHKIPEHVWEASSNWFAEQLKNDPVLQLKFKDAYRLQGDVAAVEFAHNYCQENMGKAAEKAKEQKTEAKNKLSPGITGHVTVSNEVMDSLKALHSKAKKSGSEEDFLAFQDAKRKAGITGSIFKGR